MRNNSHHLLLYTFTPNIPAAIMPPADVIRDIRRPDGTLDILKMLPMGYHVFFGGSMTPTGGFQFPAGVALELPQNAVLDLNSHYVNTTNAPITGEIFANLHTVDRAAVANVARTLFMNNEAITLPPTSAPPYPRPSRSVPPPRSSCSAPTCTSMEKSLWCAFQGVAQRRDRLREHRLGRPRDQDIRRADRTSSRGGLDI